MYNVRLRYTVEIEANMAHPFESEYHLGRGLDGPISLEGPIASFGEKFEIDTTDNLVILERRRFFGKGGAKQELTPEQLSREIGELPARVKRFRRRVEEDLRTFNGMMRNLEENERNEREGDEVRAQAERRFWTRH